MLFCTGDKKQLKNIRLNSHDNTVPSLKRNLLEGVTTRVYNLSRFFINENDKVMKSVLYERKSYIGSAEQL